LDMGPMSKRSEPGGVYTDTAVETHPDWTRK